jgi:hypothetical protein
MSVLLIERGRLGNQLFQYAAIRSRFREQSLSVIGFDDLLAVFDGVEARQLLSSTRIPGRLVRRLRPWIDRALSHGRLLPTLGENVNGTSLEVQTTAGLLRGPAVSASGYFQSPSAFDVESIASLRVRPLLDEQARALLDRVCTPARPRLFVHVRRGDYARWPSEAEPAILPDRWYHEAMDDLRARLPNPFFALVTDDVGYVGRVFAHVPDVVVVHADFSTDFAVMCACDGGILSASSFSWWAAYLINRRSPHAPLVAPEFWAGHRRGQWYPPAIASPFLEYRAVPSTPPFIDDV